MEISLNRAEIYGCGQDILEFFFLIFWIFSIQGEHDIFKIGFDFSVWKDNSFKNQFGYE